ncbi:hypothetical protein Ciccas_011986 [Cichlidogyrus casuarinus]|uniref:Uncharacterized protein n=1 Tax=Cichlidogyrus casuarinus TaxID=1844966 RepID=A0ABD2PR17_9PLAT
MEIVLIKSQAKKVIFVMKEALTVTEKMLEDLQALAEKQDSATRTQLLMAQAECDQLRSQLQVSEVQVVSKTKGKNKSNNCVDLNNKC